MRTGTWNLEGRWSEAHLRLIDSADCDVWLLTEVSDDVAISGFTVLATTEPMRGRVRWAAVASRLPLESLPDPHAASAMARVGGVTYVCSVLPWRGCGNAPPWCGADHATRTCRAVDSLTPAMSDAPLCWDGDWNHALSGREFAGDYGGRAAITAAVSQLG